MISLCYTRLILVFWDNIGGMEKMPRYSRNWNVYERINYALQVLKPATEGLSERDIQGCPLHIWHLRIGRLKTLTDRERLIYDLLLQKGLSAKTLYEWMLLTNAPAHIKDKLRDCKISMKDASAMSYR
jgi:hypothetical protein